MNKNELYTLTNDNGLIVEFISQGGKITSVKVPEGEKHVDVLLGYDTVEEAINGDDYFGALCGRVANRITEGEFILDGKTYQLEKNDVPNALHGGTNGYQVQYWNVEEIKLGGCTSAYKLSLTSPDGDGNYPGELKVELIYSLNNKNEFSIDISAETDKTTIVNLTSHPYFNLNGVGNGNVLNHLLEIDADKMTPLNENSVPTGEFRDIEGTAMDFRKAKLIKEAVESDDEQIKMAGGLDHNWVLNKAKDEYAQVLKLSEPVSGRSLELLTTQPGVQVYTGMHFDGSEIAKNKTTLNIFDGVAIEAQNFPDAINHADFPSPVLKPDERYEEKIVYRFGF